jgi:hypothetical protein
MGWRGRTLAGDHPVDAATLERSVDLLLQPGGYHGILERTSELFLYAGEIVFKRPGAVAGRGSVLRPG